MCCRYCYSLISRDKKNKYNDIENLCLAKGLFIIRSSVTADRSKESICCKNFKERPYPNSVLENHMSINRCYS